MQNGFQFSQFYCIIIYKLTSHARRTDMKLQQQDDSPNIRYSYSKSFKMENVHIHNHYEMLFLVDVCSP